MLSSSRWSTTRAEIGWTPLSPQEASEKRGGVDGIFFRDELEIKLAQFNPLDVRRYGPTGNRTPGGNPADH